MKRLYIALLLVALLVSGCRSFGVPGSARRNGYTVVPAILSTSLETISGSTTSAGWSLLWVQADEFSYCIAEQDATYVAQIQEYQLNQQGFVVFYEDGGLTTTAGCDDGLAEQNEVRVVGLESFAPNMDLDWQELGE